MPFIGVMVAADVVDSFYVCSWEALAPWFAMEHVFTAEELDISQARNEAGILVDLLPSDAFSPELSSLIIGGLLVDVPLTQQRGPQDGAGGGADERSQSLRLQTL